MQFSNQFNSRTVRIAFLTLACAMGFGCGGVEQATTSQDASRTAESMRSAAVDSPAESLDKTQQPTPPAMPPQREEDLTATPSGAMESLAELGSDDPAATAVESKSEPQRKTSGVGASSRSMAPNSPMDQMVDSELTEEAEFGATKGGGFGGNVSNQGEISGQRNLGLSKRRVMSVAGGRPIVPGRSADGFQLQAGEELWVIAKPDDGLQQEEPSGPGSGSLMAKLPNASALVPVPLKHTAVEATIDGYIATVNVNQQFHNPYESKIEATYVFPLPHSAAVNEFVMTIGDRKIRGIIREREKAEKIYEAAKNQGHVASLMTQERANIFTQKVANIEPGKQIDIHIRYFNTLRYDDGAYEFVFPMVVGPRYNPPGIQDGIGAVARKAKGTSGQETEVAYLSPDERSGHDISLSLSLNSGVTIEDVSCINHDIKQESTGKAQRRITLSADDNIPNKDFVLRYKVAGDQVKTAMLTHADDEGKYFTMMLYPPANLQQIERSPMEMVFVLDCSGSMRGKPLGQAKNAVAHALQSLTPRDTFQIIDFSSSSSQLGAEPVVANEQNIQAGLEYLYSLNGGGGTEMMKGINAALDFPHDEGRFRLVSFMTDGFIGNEDQILSLLNRKLGASRIFSFGVGSSPNRMLMDRMAILGKGAVAYLGLNDDAMEIMDRFINRISHPAMTDLNIDWGKMDVADVYPARMPDLIVGRPVVITGRFKGEPRSVKVTGLAGMQPTSFEVSASDEKAAESHPGIAAVWARLKIKDMMNTARKSPAAFDEIKGSVLNTALTHNLMSNFTAFVAVDSMTKTKGEMTTTVVVPVQVPEGVNYESTVGESDKQTDKSLQ